MMVGAKRSEEVVDPNLETRPSTSALKRAILTALRCVDPNAQQRPTMSQVVRMLDSGISNTKKRGSYNPKEETSEPKLESLRKIVGRSNLQM